MRSILLVVFLLSKGLFAESTHPNLRVSYFLGFGFANESNIFKSPETFDSGAQDLEKDARFLRYRGGLDIDKRVGRKNRFRVRYEYEATKYLAERVLNRSSHQIDINWRHRFTRRWRLNLGAEIGKNNRKGTDIFGKVIPQEFSNIDISFRPTIVYRIDRDLGVTRVRLIYVRKNKNYTEPLCPIRSLDYTQDRIALDLTQGIGKHLVLNLGYDLRFRRYRENLAATREGNDNTEGKKRQQNYRIISLGSDIRLSERGDFDMEYTHRKRIDPYQDYHTYSANIFAIRFNYEITPTTDFTVRARYKSRRYKVQIAQGTAHKLTFNNIDSSIRISQQITSFLSMYLIYVIDNRNTNTERKDAMIEQDYKQSTIRGGLLFSM